MELNLNNTVAYMESMHEDSKYYDLLNKLHTLMMELEGHKGRKIKVGNNAFAPLNEKDYTLADYKVLKCKDGQHKAKDGITLTITVSDENGEETSFVYPFIIDLNDTYLPPAMNTDKGTLKFHITVRNKCVDSYIDEIDSIENLYNRHPKEVVNVLRELSFSVYRFFLYD
jgi:hypothetical protein